MRGVGATQANRAQALLLLLLVVDLLQVRGLHVALPVLEPLLPLALASRVERNHCTHLYLPCLP